MNVTDKLNLISKILDSEGVYIENDIQKKINELKILLKQEYSAIIKEGDFPEKVKSIEILNYICKKIEVYIENSMCIGKTVIGIIVDDKINRKELTKNIIGIDERKFALNLNNSFPTVYFNAEESLYIVNKFNLVSEINKDDMKTIFNSLMGDKQIDLRKSVKTIINSQNTKYQNIVFILFPKFCDKSSEEFKSLLDITDCIIIYNNEKLDLSLRYLRNIDYKKKIYIENSNSDIKKNNLNILEFEEYVLEENNRQIYNIDFESHIDNILLNQIIYYIERNKILNENVSALRKALLIQEDNYLKNFKLSIEKQINLNNNIIEELISVRKKFFSILKDINSIIQKKIDIDNIKLLNESSVEVLYDRINKLIKLKYYDQAKELIEKINISNSLMYSILRLRCEKSMNKNLNQFDLNKLSENKSTEDYILKSKIEFREELNLSKIQIKEIIKDIKYLDTKDEYYLKSLSIKNQDKNKHKKYLKKAADMYHEEAKKELYDIYLTEEDNIQNMKHLASLLSKEANYYLADYYKKEKFFLSLFYLKISAALLNLEAIYDLANICYSRKDNENAIKLYYYLVSKNYKINECLLKLGLCFYYTKQGQKAVSVLEKCHDKQAYFILGKIYEYGEARMKDLHKAMEYYKKASDLGDDKSKTRYIKIKTRLESYEQKKATKKSNYSSSSSYSSYSSSSSYSDGGCFVTTAACKALGKQDDCEELQRFKELRDTYIINQADGEKIIAEYYRIAPGIVQEIESTKNPIKEYKFIWDRYIAVCYQYLLDGKYEDVKLLYIEMVKYLDKKYLQNN